MAGLITKKMSWRVWRKKWRRLKVKSPYREQTGERRLCRPRTGSGLAKEREKLEGYAEAKAKLIESRLLSPRCNQNTVMKTKAGAAPAFFISYRNGKEGIIPRENWLRSLYLVVLLY